MKRPGYLVAILVALLLAFAFGGARERTAADLARQRLVAVSWGDGRYGPAFYGAYVYLEPLNPGYSVQARVTVGRYNNYFHDCGELGRVSNEAEAVAQWGQIRWDKEGLHIGSGVTQYLLPRANLESGR